MQYINNIKSWHKLLIFDFKYIVVGENVWLQTENFNVFANKKI